MAQTYRTSEGDTVDSIAWRYYGAVTADVLRTVLEANPGLADQGAALPAGVLVELPDIDVASTAREGVSLWD